VIGPFVPAQAGQEPLDGREVTQAEIQPFADEDLVLWGDPERNQPLFLPVSLLESTPLEELPLDPIQKQILHDYPGRRRSSGLVAPSKHPTH